MTVPAGNHLSARGVPPAPHARPRRLARSAIRLVLAGALALTLSGCILKLMSGIGRVDDLGVFIDLSFDNVSVARCQEREDFVTGETRVDCLYNLETVDGSSEITSTAELIRDFGLFGVMIDPVILQVPDIAQVVAATVDDGNGPQDLVITETTAFDVQPGEQTTAETGKKFWIIDLPPAIEAVVPDGPLSSAPEFDFNFQFRLPGVFSLDPIPLKAAYAGRIEAGGQKYYFPLFPCTADFADVPEFQLPIGFPLNGFIFNLLNLYMNNETAACNGETYDFTQDDPPPMLCDIDADRDVDRNDVRAIIARRNTPAVLDDPYDIDGDGIISVIDARRCVLECTLPRCATP